MPNDSAPTPEPGPRGPSEGEVHDEDLEAAAGGLIGPVDCFPTPPDDDGGIGTGPTCPNPFPILF